MLEDIFCELCRDIASALKAEPAVEDLADIIDNPVKSLEAFEQATAEDLAGERALVTFSDEVPLGEPRTPTRFRRLEPRFKLRIGEMRARGGARSVARRFR